MPNESRGNFSLDTPISLREMTEKTLVGKVAIVSGSSGIGAAIARELSSRGAQLVVNYPFSTLLEEAKGICSSLPSRSIAVEADLSTIGGPQKLVDAAIAEFGRIDIVVNNTGLAVNKPLEEQTMNDWDMLVNLNGRGTFLLTQAALKHLTHGSGRIVNIASISARDAPPMQTIYAGTKGMIESFTRVWAKELPPKYGCTANAVSPGPTMTEGFAQAGDEMMKILQPVIDRTPAGKRLGDPSDVAFAVAFLCEEKARWINGEQLFVNGGLYVD
jgi:NAD(P)-dependent dehydrogenase (short-subunit alcohol dehydrogenase family)